VLAHFEDGALLEAYKADPWMDVHEYVRRMVGEMVGKEFDRKLIKTANFGLIYGMGVGLLAQRAGVTVDQAKEVKDAILALLPGLKQMYQDMKRRFMETQPIRTWGGREYYCEAPKLVEGRMMTFDYKLVNYLVQGSSADCTKEAMLAYMAAKPASHRMLVAVHDELLVSVPRREVKRGMECLRTAMEGVKFDLPMLSEGSVSETNWAELRPYDKKGVLCPPTK
jgi:DNA polymerase-1